MHPLTEFLQAKYSLDQRSLNSEVWNIFIETTAEFHQLNLLDVGTGTGSMLRRLIQTQHSGILSLTGLDQEAELLNIADGEIADILSQNDFKLKRERQNLIASKQQDLVKFIPVCTPLSEFVSTPDSYHVITTHAFMDLVPLAHTLTHFIDWLKPGGLFYSTINYDNETVIFPPYQDTDLEEHILMEYDNSMERRRISGLAVGGAKCGRRLYQTIQQIGLDILAYGSSDWNIFPNNGNYRDDDQVILRYLLQWIFSEAEKNSSIDATNLNHWFQYRKQQLAERQLGIIIHQLDILAQKV